MPNMSKIERNIPSRALVALSANLLSIAKKKQWDTQDAIGAAIGIGQKAAGRILNKENEPRLDTLCQIADKLNINEAALLLPDMGAVEDLSNVRVSEDLRPLIDALIRLDNDGMLTEQVIAFLKQASTWQCIPLRNKTFR
jgi:transcriptional regulator with XRE-family HTH domain